VLDTYIDDTMTGGGRAVKILSIATTAGKIAGTVLLITGLFGALTRAMTAEAAEGALTDGTSALPSGGPPPVTRSPIAFQKTYYAGPEAADAKTLEQAVDKAAATLDSGAGSVGTAAPNVPFLKEIPGFADELQRLTCAAHATFAKDRLLTMDEIENIAKAAKAKFGL